MATNLLSKLKIKNNSTEYGFNDEYAIKKVIFNGKEYTTSPEKNYQIEIKDSFVNELKLNNILIKKICTYGEQAKLSYNGLYAVKEENNDFSGYSLFLCNDKETIRLTTPTQTFEDKDLDFNNIIISNYPKYITWEYLIYDNIFQDERQIYGTDSLGTVFNGEILKVYFCQKYYNSITLKTIPYIVYKETKDGIDYLVKQYVEQTGANGSVTLLTKQIADETTGETKTVSDGFYCSFNADRELRNNFAQSIERK